MDRYLNLLGISDLKTQQSSLVGRSALLKVKDTVLAGCGLLCRARLPPSVLRKDKEKANHINKHTVSGTNIDVSLVNSLVV